jgi:hypothetical protein
MTTDQSIEDEIQAKGLTAPRVTLADVQENVLDTEIHKHVTKSGQVLRWAILTTRCGFAIVGNPSCSVSAENDDEDIGTKVALQNSLSALWPLMDYELRQRLHDQAAQPAAVASTFQDRVRAERADLHDKIQKLGTFIGSPIFDGLNEAERMRLHQQVEAMAIYLDLLDDRIRAFEPAHAVG